MRFGPGGGIALALVGVEVLRKIGAERIPRLAEVAVDGRVLAAMVALHVALALVLVLVVGADPA